MLRSRVAALYRREGVWLIGAALVVLVWAGTLGYGAWTQHLAALNQGRALASLHALGLEQHVNQRLRVVELAASGLHTDPRDDCQPDCTDMRWLNQDLLETARSLPFVRSLSLVDAAGRVQASSEPRNLGRQIALVGFYPPAPEGEPSAVLQVGPTWRGRDLHDADTEAPTQPGSVTATEVTVLPALTAPLANVGGLRLLATLNPDYFVNRALLGLPEAAGVVHWLRYDGLVLMSSATDAPLGHTEADLLARLQKQAFGGYDGAHAGRPTLSTYRTASNFPLVVQVHLYREPVLAPWRTDLQQQLAVGLPTLLLLGVTAVWYRRHRRAQELQTQEQDRERRLAASVFESSHDALLVTDAQARILAANPAAQSLSGYSLAELLGQNPRILSSGLQDRVFYAALWQQLQADGHWQGELTNRHRNGGLYLARLNIVAVRHADGRLAHYCGTLVDITAQRAEQQRLQVAASVFEHAAEGIMITAPDGEIIEVNQAFSAITGYAREEAVGRNARLLSSGHQDAAFYAAMWGALREQGSWSGEVWNRRKNGEVYSELLSIAAVRDAQGATLRYVALFSDISKQKEYEQRLEQIAHYDALTGLPNRVLLLDRLRQAVAQSKRSMRKLAVLFLDLDGFKAVNDQHGHAMGDQLLTALAMRMREVLREGDTLARLGGDEFVVVLPDIIDLAFCVPLLQRLLDAASRPLQVGAQTLQVSASVGVTFFQPTAPLDAEQLLRQADLAMYEAKQQGKNRYQVFDAEQDREIRQRHASREVFHGALERGEFVLHYQPKVNLRSGALLGVEALVRWQHPQDGLLMPGQFLPALQDADVIVALGRWVLQEALRQIEHWQQAGAQIAVSVNVDALQLQQSSFMADLQALLAQHPQLWPGALELEILETSALLDVAHVTEVIRACRAIGVGFALDDFGTGYSSLTHLRHLPAQQLKIDQSFVSRVLVDPADLAMLNGVIHLSQLLGRDVLAEGVETLEHGQVLLQLGCEWGQGYAIARPMPASQVLAWAGQWQAPPIWRQSHRLRRDDLPLLLAATAHRAWVAQLLGYLRQEQEQPPELDPQACQFGRWMRQLSGDPARLSLLPEGEALEALHEEIHALGQTMIQLGRPAGLQHEARLCALRDRLLEQLRALTVFSP